MAGGRVNKRLKILKYYSDGKRFPEYLRRRTRFTWFLMQTYSKRKLRSISSRKSHGHSMYVSYTCAWNSVTYLVSFWFGQETFGKIERLVGFSPARSRVVPSVCVPCIIITSFPTGYNTVFTNISQVKYGAIFLYACTHIPGLKSQRYSGINSTSACKTNPT